LIPIHCGVIVDGRQIEDALAGSHDVLRSLGCSGQTQKAAPAEPKGRRHRRQIVGAVFVGRADENNRRAEIENAGFAGDMHEFSSS
jgi:hypothetical protein